MKQVGGGGGGVTGCKGWGDERSPPLVTFTFAQDRQIAQPSVITARFVSGFWWFFSQNTGKVMPK